MSGFVANACWKGLFDFNLLIWQRMLVLCSPEWKNIDCLEALVGLLFLYAVLGYDHSQIPTRPIL